MKRRLPAVVLAATLTWAVSTLAQNTAAAAKGTLAPIILAKDHPMHGTVFSSRLNKSSYWRAEVQRKGYDVAFNEWMRQDHPFEYAHYCTQEAKKVVTVLKNTEHYSDFNALLPKRADLRAEVKSMGFDAAFSDWLLREHPDVYRKHFGPAKPDPSMNDKQMNRGMKM